MNTNTTLMRSTLILGLLAALAGFGCNRVEEPTTGQPPTAAGEAKGDILDTAAASGSFNTFVKAVKAAGLTETLSGPGPYTVFAPTDAAFEKLPEGELDRLLEPANKEQLKELLTRHVVKGRLTDAEIKKMRSLETLNGKELPVRAEQDALMIGGAKVTQAGIDAENGVIHAVDTVMIPAKSGKSG